MTTNEAKLLSQFKKERLEAMLSLDLEKIRAYLRKWGEPAFADKSDFELLIASYKAITGMTDAPMAARQASKRWLTERGFKSMDNGDVTI